MSRADQRAHSAQRDVLEGLGEDLPLGLDAVLRARHSRVLTKEAVSQFLRRALEIRKREGGRPDLCQRGHRGYRDVPHQREAVGEVPAEVVGVLVANSLEVPVDEGHLEACLTCRPEYRPDRGAGFVHDLLVEVRGLLGDRPELVEHLSLVA